MPIRYQPYFPDSIEGQALLDNFRRAQRVLKYRDNGQTTTRILRGMPLFEAELTEKVGEPGDAPNLLLRGECLTACAFLKHEGIEIDLVYIDPPFASGADYAKKIWLRRHPAAAQAMAKAEENLDLAELRAWEEKMYGDIWNKEDYLSWMHENLMAIKSVMSDEASIFVHLDYHIGHYVKVLLDEVFGEDNFRNEIIVKRITKNLQRQFDKINALPQGHDSIFWYTKNDATNFDAVLAENPNFAKKQDGYWKDFWNNADRPTMRYDILGVTPATGQWKWSKSRAERALQNFAAFEKSGAASLRAFWESTGRELEFLRKSPSGKIEHWIEPLETKIVDTLWTDISAYASGNKDYATEKSEALLERIIQAASHAGDVVADFFGGSGVAAAVAARLGRRFVHADVGINSIQTARDRLKNAGAAFEVRDIRDGISLLRNPQQTMDKLPALIPGLHRDPGLSDAWAGAIHSPKDGMVPVFVPNLLDHRSRLLDVPMLSRLLAEAMPALPDGVRRAVVYFIDIEDVDSIRDFLDTQNTTQVEIELRDLKPVLEQSILPDVVEFDLEKLPAGGFKLSIRKFLSDRLKTSLDNYNLRRQQNHLQKSATAPGKHDGPGQIEISPDGLELIEMLAVDCTHDAGAWHSDDEIKIDKNSLVLRNGLKTNEFWDGTLTTARRPLRLKVRNIAGDEAVVQVG